MHPLHRLATRDHLRATILGACALVLCAGGAVAGCSDAPATIPGGNTPEPQATGENRGQEMFAALEQDLYSACGSCHDAGGIADTPFLAGPDRYKTAVSWPGIVTKDPADSLFLTHAVVGGGHSGPNLDGDQFKDKLLAPVQDWLEEEARGIVDDQLQQADKPKIDPFIPIIGFNAIYLDALGEAFVGMALTFNADQITDSLLQLSEMQFHTTTTTGVHIVHPLFVVYPKGLDADPDPTDSFSAYEDYIDVGISQPFDAGLLILTNWRTDARLSVAFEVIEPYTATGGGGAGGPGGGGGCINVDSFIANAQGQLQQNCVNCHGGNNGQATSALDMTQLGTDPAAACAQVKNRVTPEDPPSSQIFITTDPAGNAAHPFKFGGDGNAFGGFRASVSNWIAAEQQP